MPEVTANLDEATSPGARSATDPSHRGDRGDPGDGVRVTGSSDARGGSEQESGGARESGVTSLSGLAAGLVRRRPVQRRSVERVERMLETN